MKAPTWKDVKIPDCIPLNVKGMQSSYGLDCLISQLVFHRNKTLYVSYLCNGCGYNHIPERSTDEVSQCPNCQAKFVRCVQSLRPTDKKTPYYSRSGLFIIAIINQMRNNFASYFHSHPERDMDWEWHDGIYHVAFAGGETAVGEFPRIAVARACLLTPYIWDRTYDWRLLRHTDTKPIGSLFTNFMMKKNPYA